jgi:hypothetical protein
VRSGRWRAHYPKQSIYQTGFTLKACAVLTKWHLLSLARSRQGRRGGRVWTRDELHERG